KPFLVLTSCVVMRSLRPERRTLPSRIAPTLSLRAMVPTSVSLPLKEKEDVRALTCSSLIRTREFRISSVRPSERYSCSLSPLMLTNGNTAIECGGGLKAATAAAGEAAFEAESPAAIATECTTVPCFESQNLSAKK